MQTFVLASVFDYFFEIPRSEFEKKGSLRMRNLKPFPKQNT